MFPGFALSSAPPSCHHGRGAGAGDVDKGVLDLASARDHIRSVVTGVELGRGPISDLYHRRGSPCTVS